MEVSTMLGKLMKYDLKSMFKVFVPLWLALLAVSVVNRFTIQFDSNAIIGGLPTVIFMILYVGLIIAVMVVAVALIIMRFYHGLLKDEGYLMFTLPVRPWQLVTSKCLTATIVSILSLLAAVLSVCLIAVDASFVPDLIRAVRDAVPHLTGDMVLTIILTVLLAVAAVITSVTHIYASLALGHLAHSHRVGWSVLAYIGINMLFSALAVLLGNLADRMNWNFEITVESGVAMANIILAILLAVCVVQIVIFFVVTERILSKRLNLE